MTEYLFTERNEYSKAPSQWRAFYALLWERWKTTRTAILLLIACYAPATLTFHFTISRGVNVEFLMGWGVFVQTAAVFMSLVLTFGKATANHVIPDRTLTLPIPMTTWLAATFLSTFLLFLALTATQLAVIGFLTQNLFPPQLPSSQIPELLRVTLLFASYAFGISLWLHAWLLLLGDHHPATAIGTALALGTLTHVTYIELGGDHHPVTAIETALAEVTLTHATYIELGFWLVAKTILATAALAPPIAAALLANRCRYHAWTEWEGLSPLLPTFCAWRKWLGLSFHWPTLTPTKRTTPSARRARARIEWHDYGQVYLLLTIPLAFVVWFCGILFDFGRTSPLHVMLLFSSVCIGAVGAALCGGALQEIRASQAQKTRPAFFSLQAPMTTRAIAEARIWAIARGALVPMAVVTVAYFLAQLPLLLKMDGQQLDQYRWHTLPWAINTSIVFLFVIWMLATHNWRFILYAAIGVGTMEFAEEFAKRQGMSPNILAITTTLAITLFLFFRACKRHLVLVKPLLTITAAVFLYLLLSLSRHLTTLSMDDLFRALGTLRIDDLGTLAVFWLVALWPALTIPVTIHNQRHR